MTATGTTRTDRITARCANGEQVTVTHRGDDGITRTWHAHVIGLRHAIVASYSNGHYGYAPHGTTITDGDARTIGPITVGTVEYRPWVSLTTPAGTNAHVTPQGLAPHSATAQFGMFGADFDLDDPALTISPLTEAGRVALIVAETTDGKRERLLRTLSHLDADLAADLRNVIEDLESEAYSRGADSTEYDRR